MSKVTLITAMLKLVGWTAASTAAAARTLFTAASGRACALRARQRGLVNVLLNIDLPFLSC